MSAFAYLSNLLQDRYVASVMPTSRFAVEKICSRVDLGSARVVIEYGPGTGVFTRALLRRMRPDARLVAIERNEALSNVLRRNCSDPRLQIYNDCAGIMELIQTELKDPTSSLLDFLVKICQLLETGKDLKDKEVVYFLEQLKSLNKRYPNILSLKMLKDCSPQMRKEILKRCFTPSPTLGIMVNGNCLILNGYYPKIENGYTLSDILEEDADQKYFLSQEAISKLKIKQKKN